MHSFDPFLPSTQKTIRLVFPILLSFILVLACHSNRITAPSGNSGPHHKNYVRRMDPKVFDTLIQTRKVGLYVLRNQKGMELTATNYGLRIVSLLVPDRHGALEDVVLGFDSIHKYLVGRSTYIGSIIGQYANRIKNGRVNIDGHPFQLDQNEGENHLHGGSKGYGVVVWDVTRKTKNTIVFHKRFPDGQNGYPGNVDVTVTYKLTDHNEVVIRYEAKTDRATVINLTNHSFFNLNGEGHGTIDNHLITINADQYLAVNQEMVPLQYPLPVTGTPFDFRSPRSVAEGLNHYDDDQLRINRGYNHTFILKKSPTRNDGLTFAARVMAPRSGIVLEVYTSEPGVQFYTGNFLDGSLKGKSGVAYAERSGLCLETQHFPDSPNNPSFPSTLLRPEDAFESTTVYKFRVYQE